MHTIEMLSQASELARQLGYQIREDHLEGAGGGHCLIHGRKWLLLDLTQSAHQQLDDVLDAIRNDPGLGQTTIPPALVDPLQCEPTTQLHQAA